MDTKTIELLERVRHELITLDGLLVADEKAPSETWVISESGLIEEIDQLIESSENDTHPS